MRLTNDDFCSSSFSFVDRSVSGTEKVAGAANRGRLHNMILLGLMHLDIAVAQGLRYVQLAVASVCRSYHPAGMEHSIAGKKARLENYRRSLGNAEYVRRRHYNRKILE